MNTRTSVASALRFLWPRSTAPRVADHALVGCIRDSADRLSKLPDACLAQQTANLRQQAKAGQSALETPAPRLLQSSRSAMLVPTFALVMEAARRALGIELYDVQLLGGLALCRGAVAEMQTGEGKTFAALFPACAHALAGHGVHVMTVNAYLAARDSELLTPVYRLLGFSVGLIHAEADASSKRAAYLCDITYGPGYEFGFDYLRDQAAIISRRRPALGESFRRRLQGHALEIRQPMQRGHAATIVDEADSVLLDEATTPLLLAVQGGTPSQNGVASLAAAEIASRLEIGVHYEVNRAAGTLRLTPAGLEQLAARSNGVPPRELDRPWPVYIEQALRAEWIIRRDVHYIVADDQIQLVDQHTGRIFADRTWRDGLQQAIQAKAGVTITAETEPMARITRQRYLRRYQRLCGMTGTAQGAERELRDLYGLDVVIIPTNRPSQRCVLPLRVFADCVSKERAIAEEIVRVHRFRRPVLVGTASIETSERLARALDERQVPYQLLNGKQDAREAAIVAGAGQLDAVTIATNMAGRGTDIRLGAGVVELAGLHVIATEPQQSARIDRQLAGRAARQGDPGSYQLFASADDELFARHAASLSNRMRKSAAASGEAPSGFCREIADIHRQIEREQANLRRQLFEHDDWLESVLADLAPSD